MCLSASSKEVSIPLGKHCTVFQAEITAIMVCALENRLAGCRGKRICICSDSQAARKALKRQRTNSRLVRKYREALQQLADVNRVTLIWVPGHEGIAGNEKTDELARSSDARRGRGKNPSLPPLRAPYGIQQ